MININFLKFMLQNKINGVLGVWIIVLAFLGFSDSMHRFLLIISGIAIIVVSFYGKSLFKPTEELVKDIGETKETQEPHGENQLQ